MCSSSSTHAVGTADGRVMLQDNLAMAAIRFLNTVAAGVHHSLFNNEGVLCQVCPCMPVLAPLTDSAAAAAVSPQGCIRIMPVFPH